MKKTKHLVFVVLALMFLAYCKNTDTKTAEKADRLEVVPEPDKALRLKVEAIEKLKQSNCSFSRPDTSINNIILRNAESAVKVIGKSNRQYKFYSNLERETLTLKQLPNDKENQFSVIKVENSNKLSYNYKFLKIDTFKTEKGIKLGLTKKQIVAKLGKCYATIDSTEGYIELYYLMELPTDSKSKILSRNKMPKYFASYKLWNDKLAEFEFGFEYP